MLVIAGIFLDSWFPEMSMMSNCLKWPNSLGRELLKELFANSKNFSWEAKKNCFGMLPLSAVLARTSISNRWHVAILMGILPDNRLFVMSSSYNRVKLLKIS